jgi:hypothetical protein
MALSIMYAFALFLEKRETPSVDPTGGMVFDHPDPKDPYTVPPKRSKRPKKQSKKQQMSLVEAIGQAKKYPLIFGKGIDHQTINLQFAEDVLSSFKMNCRTPSAEKMLASFKESKAFEFIATAKKAGRQVYVSAIPVLNSTIAEELVSEGEHSENFVSVDPLTFLHVLQNQKFGTGLFGNTALTSVNAVTPSGHPGSRCSFVYKGKLFSKKRTISSYNTEVVHSPRIYRADAVKEIVLCY